MLSILRLPDRLASLCQASRYLAWCCIAVCAVGAWGIAAKVAASPAATPEPVVPSQRAQLLKEQAALQTRFDEELAACRKRFAVTGCVEAVERQRRAAMAPLREGLIQLDEVERQQRAAARLQVLAENELLAEQRKAAAAQAIAAAASEAASAPPRRRLLPAAAPLTPMADSANPASAAAAAASARAADAAQRVREAQRRAAESEQRRLRVEKRLAEREAKNKSGQSLPPPARPASQPRP